MIKISNTEGVEKHYRRKFPLVHTALSIKSTKALIKKKQIMNKFIPPHLNQNLGFFSLTALL